MSAWCFSPSCALVGLGVAGQAEKEAVREVGDKAKMLGDAVDIVDTDLRKQVGVFARVYSSWFPEGFAVDGARRVAVGPESMPVLSSGGKMMNLNFSVPDRFTALTGCTPPCSRARWHDGTMSRLHCCLSCIARTLRCVS